MSKLHTLFFMLPTLLILSLEGFARQQTYSSINVRVTNIDSITTLPFGSKILVTQKFPKTWNKSDKLHEKSILKAIMEYGKINYSKSLENVPDIQSFKRINIGEDAFIIKDRRKYSSGFKCRLPNVGIYQCFYQSSTRNFDDPDNPITTKDKKNYMDMGNLILYDPLTKSAYILNVYNTYAYTNQVDESFYRLFYIDRDYKIKIFDFYGEEDGATLKKTHEITIGVNGKISIKKLIK